MNVNESAARGLVVKRTPLHGMLQMQSSAAQAGVVRPLKSGWNYDRTCMRLS
jgi:hypothetical protein